MTHTDHSIEGGPPTERLKRLKHQIALRQYDVDPALVAEAIVRKLVLVRRGREALAASPEAGRTHAERPPYRREP